MAFPRLLKALRCQYVWSMHREDGPNGSMEDVSTPMRNTRVIAWERHVEKWMLFLSLVFLTVMIIPLASPISSSEKSNLEIVDWSIWAIFAFDYFIKVAIADDLRSFVKSHVLELLIVVVPFLRPLRLLRLIPVIGYFITYSRRTMAGRLLRYVSLAAVLLTAPAAVLMYQVEKDLPNSNIKSIGDALWWASVTVTTVGYGDRYPVSALGRLLAVAVMVVGISLIGVITAAIASWFVKADEIRADQIQMRQILNKLDELEAKIMSQANDTIEN
jgi:voltage-gated potassium channel